MGEIVLCSCCWLLVVLVVVGQDGVKEGLKERVSK